MCDVRTGRGCVRAASLLESSLTPSVATGRVLASARGKPRVGVKGSCRTGCFRAWRNMRADYREFEAPSRVCPTPSYVECRPNFPPRARVGRSCGSGERVAEVVGERTRPALWGVCANYILVQI